MQITEKIFFDYFNILFFSITLKSTEQSAVAIVYIRALSFFSFLYLFKILRSKINKPNGRKTFQLASIFPIDFPSEIDQLRLWKYSQSSISKTKQWIDNIYFYVYLK